MLSLSLSRDWEAWRSVGQVSWRTGTGETVRRKARQLGGELAERTNSQWFLVCLKVAPLGRNLESGCIIVVMRTFPGVLSCITHHPLYIIQTVCLLGLGNFGALKNTMRIHFTKMEHKNLPP